jgi:hypothetical protein
MAIVFNCPHCEHPYKLKDDLAGKRATCKNTSCRQQITIPQPTGFRIADLGGIVPDDATPNTATAPPADVEAAALAALNETAQEKEETAAADEIPMTCPHCDHKWAEPFAKAGKNTLCPNEECRQRIKVPEPKKGQVKENWRSTASGKPSLAKENFEKPTDVMDAEAKVVSREAYVKGGGAEQDYEPVPLKRRLFVWSLIAAPILLVAAGIWAIVSWRSERREELSLEPAIAEFAAAREELDPVQASLGSAILEIAAGQHALAATKMDKDKAFAQAVQHFKKAHSELQTAAQKDPQNRAAADRFAVAGELAVALVGLGGTDEEAKENQRHRWVPASVGNRALRPNEQNRSVHAELQTVLGSSFAGADFDTKATVVRRLARDLAKKGQADLVASLASFCFSDSEQPEAKAVAALEVYRADRGSDMPKKTAEELKAILAGGAVGRVPSPASAQTLWEVVGTEKAPKLFPPPSASVVETSRYAFVGVHILKDESAKALDLCRQQGGTLNGQLRALALYAEWAPDPAPAFDSAISAISLSAKAKKEAPPATVVLRLVQLAASANRPDQAKSLSDAIPDEGVKAWAKGSAIQFAATPENKNKIEDAAFEVPDDPKRLRAGHFQGKLWQSRQNARSMSASDATKAVNLWPRAVLKPFGLAGIALAQQDK